MGANGTWSDLIDYLKAIQVNGEYSEVGERLPVCIRKLVLYDDTLTGSSGGPVRLVHYTSWDRMLKMFAVENGEHPVLRMYNYEFANDPEEGNIRPPEWSKVDEEVAALLCEYDPEGSEERARGGSTYGCSFSSNGDGVEDDLMFWRLYGNNGAGGSLRLGGMPKGIYRVRYRNDRGLATGAEASHDKSVTSRLRQLLDLGKETVDKAPDLYKRELGKHISKALGQVLDGYFHLVKNKAYEHEHEWRMISVMPEEDEIKYEVGSDGVVRRYVAGGEMKILLSSSDITLGPTMPNCGAARGYIETLVRRHGMKHTKVKVSSKKYR